MRALILRRVALIETGAGGPVLIGSPDAPDVARLRNFLARNGIPHMLLDPAADADAQAFVEHYAPGNDDMPLVACPDGSVLRNPAESVLGRCIGMLDTGSADEVYDVAIAGAGPAGLATAVYAASEGLSVIVIDARAYGGQAGASARIENYLGFPTGISGMALAGRAYTQARKFGARMLIPSEIVELDCDRPRDSDPLGLRLADGRTIRSRTVVLATGARYRRPDCADLQAMEGRGVWYWASPIEARMCAGQEVILVGGGNSAGQGAVFLVVARGEGVDAGARSGPCGEHVALSDRPHRRDAQHRAAHAHRDRRTQRLAADGTGERAVAAPRHGQEETRAIRNVFLFLGADPATDWLKDCGVALDDKGFVRTGSSVDPGDERAAAVPRLPLEASVPGVFAIGDVRAGSIKRVGGAIGEGAAVVAQVHAFIARQESARSIEERA